MLKKNLNKRCDLHSSNLSQHSDRGGESLHGPTLQNCDTNEVVVNNEVCLTPQSLGQEYLVASNTITNCTLLKFNVNYVLFVLLHNCVHTVCVSVKVLCLWEHSENISKEMVLKCYSRHSDVFVENWGHDGRMALG